MDKHLKRNKSKDNPYILDYDEDKKTYIVTFIDNLKITRTVEISDEVYEAFDRFELEDISQIHKVRKHIEHNEVYEETLYHRATDYIPTLDEIVENKVLLDQVKDAMNLLTKTQKQRIYLYFFEDKNFSEIARIEKCDESSVRESIYAGIKKLKKIYFNTP